MSPASQPSGSSASAAAAAAAVAEQQQQQPASDGRQIPPERQEQQAKEAEMRNNILSAVLTQEARARLATLGAAKPDRAKMVENIIIQNTRMGAIRGKVDENSLKGLLEKVNDQTKRETKVQFERRRVFDDSDDEE